MQQKMSHFRIGPKSCKVAEMLSYWPQINSSDRSTLETPGASEG